VRLEQQRFRAAVNAVRGTVWTNDASGRMKGVQPGWAALTGQSLDEYQDYGWAKAVHPADVQPTIDAWEAAVAARTAFTFEHRVRRAADGQWRTFAIRAIPLVDDAGEVLEWVGVHTDVTEARNAENALREADYRKDVFIATLAHELRNPLAPVRNALQVARSDKATDAQRRWSHDVIDRQVRHMALLLDDLLDVSRITRGTLQLRPERVELSAVVDLAIETSRPLIDARQHTLTVKLPDVPVFLSADALRLAQVLSNLLNNAAKYSEPRGRIVLQASNRDGLLRLEVSDSGIGIEADMLPNIFEMFSQSVHAIERSEGGLGIGLALVKGLVALHGGTVEATSGGRGAGSTFVVTIPCERVGSVAAQIAAHELPPATTPRRILVVDDNADSAESLALMLHLQGHETRSARDGEQALEIATSFRPHAVLLDIGMPGLNGYEVARRLRAIHLGQPLTLIAVTGWGQAEDRKRALAAGFDHHLVKPVDPLAMAKLLAA
jgi:PAS domain S-box-containing protein